MSPKRPYGSTSVPVSKSQDELRGLLQKFGAAQFTFGEGRDWAGVEFVHDDHLVRMRCPLRTPTDREVRSWRNSAHCGLAEATQRLLDGEAQRVWRVMVWSVKARLVSVEEGLEQFSEAFFSHVVDPASGRTVWEQVREPIEDGVFRLGGPGMRALEAGRG